MFIRSRSTDTLTRTTAVSATTTPRRTSPSPSRVSRTFSATAPIPIPVVSNPHSTSPPSTLSRLNINMFRRSSSVAMLQPTKHRESFSHTAPIYVPRSSATHIPTPSHPTPHASSAGKRGGKHHNNNNHNNNNHNNNSNNNKSTRAPMMARAPRVRRNRRPFKASSSSRARGEHHDSYDPRDDDMDPPCEEHIQPEHELPTTLTGSWQDSPVLPVRSHAGTSPPSLTLSRSTSATSETSSTPDLILFSDHSDHTMSPASSMSTISTPSTSSSSSPIMLSSSLSSSASPVLTYHTPAASDYELVNDSSLTAGQCGSYLVRARQTTALSIFKPQDEEMYEEKRLLLDMTTQNKLSGVRITEVESPRSDSIPGSISMVDVVDKTPIKKGVVYGDAALKEVAAYLMDHESFAGVPPTISTSLVLKRNTSDNNKDNDTPSSALVQFGPTPPGELVFGSLQEYRQHMCSAEDIGSSLFGIDEVHKIGVLDIRLLNLDRHLGNLLVSKDDNGYHLIPIDHGYTLPSYQDLSDVALEWRWWRQSAAAFSQRTLEYIARLDPLEDARVLRMLGIRDESLVSLVFSTMLLQRAAQAGLTLQTIASMVCRDGLGETPSTLEMIISQVLALMKSGADVTLQDVTAASTATTTTTSNPVAPATSNEPTATAEAPTEKSSDITTTVSSLSIQPSDDDTIVSPTSTSLPIEITPPTGSPATSPVASPCSSSVSSTYSSSPSGSSISSSLSSLTNFSLKPSPSIQRLFSFATLPTVTERSHTRNSSTCESHVEEEEEEEVEPELLDHESFPSWESDGEHEQEEIRARVGSMSSSNENESGSEEENPIKEGTRSPTRRRGSRKSSSSPIPNNVDSPASSSCSPVSSLPVVPADDLSDRLARLLHTTTVVIDREVARIKSNMTSTAQA